MGQVADPRWRRLHGGAVHRGAARRVPRGRVHDRAGRQDDLRADDAGPQEASRAPVRDVTLHDVTSCV